MTIERRELVNGVRFTPSRPSGAGVLVLAGSSGRVDERRAELLAATGATCEAVRWFGGPGQPAGPWLVPLETVIERIAALRATCDRIVLVGTSFGAEVVLATAAVHPVDAVAAFAPSDVVWAGITGGRQVSHFTHGGGPLAFVPFVEDWTSTTDPPAFRDLYATSFERVDPVRREAATIAVENIPHVVLVAGGDDAVWPSTDHAARISARRERHGLMTEVIIDREAGHRTVLPGEDVVTGGMRMARGGTEAADRRLGERAWEALVALL